jgi:hypothetical protein
MRCREPFGLIQGWSGCAWWHAVRRLSRADSIDRDFIPVQCCVRRRSRGGGSDGSQRRTDPYERHKCCTSEPACRHGKPTRSGFHGPGLRILVNLCDIRTISLQSERPITTPEGSQAFARAALRPIAPSACRPADPRESQRPGGHACFLLRPTGRPDLSRLGVGSQPTQSERV